MADDALTALGLELRAEAAAWLAELTRVDFPDGTHAARELFHALAQLEAEVADAAADEVELTQLQAWLTAGFFAAPDPYAPAERGGGGDGRGAARGAGAVQRGIGKSGDGSEVRVGTGEGGGRVYGGEGGGRVDGSEGRVRPWSE